MSFWKSQRESCAIRRTSGGTGPVLGLSCSLFGLNGSLDGVITRSGDDEPLSVHPNAPGVTDEGLEELGDAATDCGRVHIEERATIEYGSRSRRGAGEVICTFGPDERAESDRVERRNFNGVQHRGIPAHRRHLWVSDVGHKNSGAGPAIGQGRRARPCSSSGQWGLWATSHA